MKTIYLDHNATTPLNSQVLDAMMPFLKDKYGNPSSLHTIGRDARQAVDKAREVISDFLQTEPVDIYFTACGTESDNIAISGVYFANQDKGKHIITSKIEHSAVLNTCRHLETLGAKVTYLSTDKYGVVDLEELKKNIRRDTILISIMHANNEIGTIQPIEEIGKIAKENKIYFHTDAVQSFCKVPIHLDKMGVDLLSVSGHKIYGPKGVAALYVRKGVNIAPVEYGGHHEKGLRPGTENVAGIVGFAKAVEIGQAEMQEHNIYVQRLRDKLYNGLNEKISNLHLNGHPTQRLSGTLNLGFEFVEGESIMLNLDLIGICVSTGSACTSGSSEPSYVLSALGIKPQVSQGSVRFSIGIDNTEEEIDYCIKNIPPIIKRLRDMSPL